MTLVPMIRSITRKRATQTRSDAPRADRHGDHSAARGGFGGGGGDGGYGERQMYSVVCAECGKDAEVPFQPRGDRPVYCSDCFRQQRDQRAY